MGQESTGNAGQRFCAFISYAHADAAQAGKLQRRIEAYRLPRQLRNTRVRLVGEASRIGQVFRDREDMAAAANLSDAIRNGLAQSDALVVMCSPAARASRWVAEEIRLFRELHSNGLILAVIVDCDPREAMPSELIEGGGEPLAADLRKGHDGQRLGLLKIVAALAGVPLDALIQRDAQRRLRRVMAVTLAVGLALLAMIMMTILAINARNEAQRQRAEAEGLVEYMLTDLSQELIAVGRIDVRTGVYDRAMDYYRAQGPVADLPEDSLERRARVLLAMGQEEAISGKLDEAARRYGEAYRTTAALLARDPANADRIFDHAQSVFYVGDVARRRGNAAEARTRALQYRALAMQLQSVDTDRVRALREIAYAEGGLCMLDGLAQATVSAAVPRCRAALSAMQQVGRLRPDDLSVVDDVGNRHAWLAESLASTGQVAAALDHQQRATAMARRLLATDPQNFDWIELLAGRLIGLASLSARAGQRDRAVAVVREAEPLVGRLMARDQSNALWQRMARDVATITQSYR